MAGVFSVSSRSPRTHFARIACVRGLKPAVASQINYFHVDNHHSGMAQILTVPAGVSACT